MGKICAIYARQSIDKPDSISIESQVERCVYEVHGAPYRVYCDRGYSGKNTDRPQFQAMIEAVRRGEIESVVCYKLDRCSRSILDFTQLMEIFQQHGVAFLSCTEKFDTATPMGRAMLSICIVFAQLERETIQQRITDAYHSRCRKGFFMGGRIPFGFTLAPYEIDGKKTSCYAPVEAEVTILRKIYSLYQSPDTSLSDVVIALEAEDIRNPRRADGLWVRPHIGRMIKNPIYVRSDAQIYHYFESRRVIIDNPREDFIGYNGCYIYCIGNEEHLVLAPHEGIVSSATWLKCQKEHNKKRRNDPHSHHGSWLTGKLKCGVCGRTAVCKQVLGKNNRTYRYFLCSGAQGKDRKCVGFKPLPAAEVEEAIAQTMKDRIKSLANRQQVCNLDRSRSGYLGERLMKLADLCKSNSLSPDQLELMLVDLRLKMNQHQNTHNGCLAERQSGWDRICSRMSQWDQIPQEKKIRIAERMIASVTLSDAQLAIFWHA